MDAVFIGPYDLSASFNKIGRIQDREVVDAINHIRDVCRAHGMPVGIHGASPEALVARIQDGFSLVSCSADIAVFAAGARQLLDTLRGAGN